MRTEVERHAKIARKLCPVSISNLEMPKVLTFLFFAVLNPCQIC